MEIVCMWCGKSMGKKDGKGTRGVTTSICRECWQKHYPQWEYPREGVNSDIVLMVKDLNNA